MKERGEERERGRKKKRRTRGENADENRINAREEEREDSREGGWVNRDGVGERATVVRRVQLYSPRCTEFTWC